MPTLRIASGTEQVVNYLRDAIHQGHWQKEMPGINVLAADLGVNRKTVDAALRQLEHEGLLTSQGERRRRIIALDPDKKNTRPLRVAILGFEAPDKGQGFFTELRYRLQLAGHDSFFTKHSLADFKFDVRQVAALVEKTEADAWVVAAASREILQWFAQKGVPTFALFGRWQGIPIAAISPDKTPSVREATKKLISMGHRRISMICRRVRRHPEPGQLERAVLDELEAAGIKTGPYNLPDWEETVTGLHQCLDSMFQITPPTALIIEEVPLFFPVQHYLARRGVLAPQHISLICTENNSHFDWLLPPVSHIRSDSEPWMRRIVRWAHNIGRGKDDRRSYLTPSEFIEGGTLGPAAR